MRRRQTSRGRFLTEEAVEALGALAFVVACGVIAVLCFSN